MRSELSRPLRRGRRGIARAGIVAALVVVLSGCGSTLKSGPTASATTYAAGSAGGGACPTTVLNVIGGVLQRVYREGISSERTVVARNLIAASLPLRQAIEAGDESAARTAAEELVATGHLTNLRIVRNGSTLVDVGNAALAPESGTLTGAAGAPIATYLFSVWSDGGFISEATGVAGGEIALRREDRSLPGSFALPPGALPSAGALTAGGVSYQFTSFPAEAYPSGALRIYVLKPLGSSTALCGATSEQTTVNTLRQVAELIYAGEAGSRTLPQVRRVQSNQPLLEAVAQHDPAATEAAVKALLHEHIVRLRVSVGEQLLADVGGPYVLAPVQAPLRLDGHTIGSFVLSIQDDEGYLRLTHRLAGLDVLMTMNVNGRPQLVKNSLGPAPGTVPDNGSYTYRGHRYSVFTLHATAFPSGPLKIQVLVPIPYL
ncbi:MAG TPA: hypothetical protein VKG38_14165 [Solirubrobacteraceae bacterium]|nr:hypothetical protein [Solirubrobacteraceae bacterium]